MNVEAIAQALRCALDSETHVNLPGLGTFRRAGAAYEFLPETKPRVFIAYAVEDLQLARRLGESLITRGCAPWIDKDQLMPGQDWPRAIESSIRSADAFVACFTRRSILKRGQFQCELRYAIDCARQVPLDQEFLIPARLERCTLPRQIADSVQYVDLFPGWERGVKRIARSVHRAARWRKRVEFTPA